MDELNSSVEIYFDKFQKKGKILLDYGTFIYLGEKGSLKE